MRSLQFELSDHWDRRATNRSHPVVLEDLQWWSDTTNLSQGHSLKSESPELFLYTDASLKGWGVSILEAEVSGS